MPRYTRVVRTGKRVHGFDVSTLNKNDVVLFVVSQTTNGQTLYLTSKGGVLRVVNTASTNFGDKRVNQSRKSLRKCLAGLRIRWFDPIAEVSELANQSRGAFLLRLLGDGWAAFFVTNSLMQDVGITL